MDRLKPLLAVVAGGGALSRQEAEDAFDQIFAGSATPAQIGALAMGLRVRGETRDEIAGAVAAMRARMIPIAAPDGAVDIVGTGGDGHGTYNVSTLAAIIVASCGVPVAKHGNRAASSRSGSSDVLAALGVDVGAAPADVERCLAETGLCFMLAQTHHPALRPIAAVRSDLGTRTIFNLLGPLANPAGVRRLVVGVYAEAWLEPIAEVLGALGAERALVVHGADGLDEITTTGPTHVAAWDRQSGQTGGIRRFTIDPESLGLNRVTLADLKGGDATQNAAALRGVLAGDAGAYRDIACLNAAAALVVAGQTASLSDGLAHARDALDSGRARATLDRLVGLSRSFAARGQDLKGDRLLPVG